MLHSRSARFAPLIPLALFALGTPAFSRADLPPGGTPDYTPVIRQLEDEVAHQMQAKAIPSMAVALVDDQRIVWAKGFGTTDARKKRPASEATVYPAGSVTKLFTGLAVMRLVEQGKLELDAPVTRYLPEFKVRTAPAKPITLRHLLTHQSGLLREPPAGHPLDRSRPTLAQVVASLAQTDLLFEPGVRTQYSNAALAVAGRIVQRVSGESFEVHVREHLLAPMGMQHTGFSGKVGTPAQGWLWTPYRGLSPGPLLQPGNSPAVGLRSSAGDLGRFLSVLFARETAGKQGVVKPSTLETMWKTAPGEGGEVPGYGLGFSVSAFGGTRRFRHGGTIYGTTCEVEGLPDEKLGVVVFCTVDAAAGVTRWIADAGLRGLRAVKHGQPLATLPRPAPLPVAEAQRLAGFQGSFRFFVHEGQLYTTPPFGAVVIPVNAIGNQLWLDSYAEITPAWENRGDHLALNGQEVPRGTAALPTPPPLALAELIGQYGPDEVPITLLERGGRLFVLFNGFIQFPVEPVAPDRYRFPQETPLAGEILEVRRDAARQVTAIVLDGEVNPRKPNFGDSAPPFRIEPRAPIAELRRAALAAQPPREKGEFVKPDLIDLATLDPTLKLDIRYATTDNFLGTPIYEAPRAFLQRAAAEALLRAHRALAKQGLGLLVYDAYRPWYVTRMFWDATDPKYHDFVADPKQGSRHNRGAAVDLTLYRLATGRPVLMPSGYDEFSDRAYPLYPGGSSFQRYHRDILRQAMENEGFRIYPTEWWHFDFEGWEKYPILNVPHASIR